MPLDREIHSPTGDLTIQGGSVKRRLHTLLLAGGALSMACATREPEGRPDMDMEPPVAKVTPQKLEIHGDVRVDDYYWLRDREDPAVIAYLEAENAYTEAVMARTERLQQELYQEIVGRIKQDDDSVPYKKGNYFYYARYEEGGDYPIYCRKKGSLDAEEEVVIDANSLAEGHEFFSMWGLEVSPDGKTAAYATDTVGRRFNTLRFRNLETGEDLPDVITDVTANGEWANDNQTFFYTKQDPETLRSHQIYRHVLRTDPSEDELVYEERDEEFSSFVYKTKSDRYLVIGSQQTLSSEMRVLDADQPDAEFRVIQPREVDHEYWVDHYGDHFYLRTNWQAKNFRLMKTPVNETGKDNWEEVIPHRDDVFFENAEIFKDYLVVTERKDGLMQMRVKPWDGSEAHYLDFGEPAYFASVSDNYEFDTPTLRFVYTSLTTPMSTIDYDMASREKTLLKEEEVLGGFDKNHYRTERVWATARDDARVPISLVYRKDLFVRDGSNPMLLYGYGSYGANFDPFFQLPLLSLLDRGFVFAIAHVRGSQALGRQWYEDGKLLTKMNTFSDFVDSAQFLIDEDYTNPDVLFAQGGSAGGLLMGAVANLAPELFSGIISHVPFVDVVTTMLDPDIPLTTSEYDEWGDPNQPAYYGYILSYSPYDNIEAKDYPHMLVTTGLHDSQVQFWEPAKYVAKLRALKTDDNRLILKTNMEAGHGGATGRLKRHKETAFDYAFLLDLAGIGE
jgi:oligopeptidase B